VGSAVNAQGGCYFLSSSLTKILKATGKVADCIRFFGCAPFVVFTNDANSAPDPGVGAVHGLATCWHLVSLHTACWH
jgi:hypothetical protein